MTIRSTTAAAAMPDRRWVFGLDDGHIRAWDALTGRLVAEARGHGGVIEPRRELAILGAEVWSLKQGRLLIGAGMSSERALAAGISGDARYGVIGSNELHVLDLEKKALKAKIRSGIGDPSFLALSPDADYLAVGADSNFTVYDVVRAKPARLGSLAAVWPFRQGRGKRFDLIVEGRAREFDVIYQSKGSRGRIGDSALWMIDWNNAPVNVFSDYLPPTGLRSAVRGAEVDIVYAPSGDEVSRLAGGGHAVQRVAFSPDRWSVATADASGAVVLWDVYSGEARYRCVTSGDPVRSLSFSPDGQFLLAATPTEIRIYAVGP